MRRELLAGATAALVLAGALALQGASSASTDGPEEAEEGCHPTAQSLPVCPAGASAEEASFLDPTVRVVGAEHISLAEAVYVGPFAELVATEDAPITIGPETNVQDNVLIQGSRGAGREDETGDGHAEEGVEIADRVIMAHGVSVLGPAQIGVEGGDIAADPDDDQEVFLSFSSQVDGAILEKNTGVSALGRVGPGVRLRSGFIVLPGKNVTTQEQADDPALGKVRPITEADVAFNEAVLEVNVAFAREYSELAAEDPTAVHGANVDPGGTEFNEERDEPSFAGTEQVDPDFRNRIIGDVDLVDRLGTFSDVSGDRISLRADEGEPFAVGAVAEMGDDVIFHALEEADLWLGQGIRYGDGVVVHGGGRVVVEGQPAESTRVGHNVVLGDQSVVFRSTIGDGAVIGERSAVVGTDLPPGTVVPPFTIIVGGAIFGPVEW